MNIIQRNSQRRHIRSDKSETWFTFYHRKTEDSLNDGFGIISVFNEVRLSSNESFTSDLESESELITYVHKGALAFDGPEKHSGVITAGEFQCMTIGRVPGQRVTNTSQTDLAHFFRVYLRLLPLWTRNDFAAKQARFTAAQRRNILCTVASLDARSASLRIYTDAHIYSSILDPGQHVVYELPQGRKAWLHIVYGRIQANDVELAAGDGMGIADEPSISLTVRENTELLLVDTVSGSGNAHGDMDKK